jgi:hypothetical protein
MNYVEPSVRLQSKLMREINKKMSCKEKKKQINKAKERRIDEQINKKELKFIIIIKRSKKI